MSRFLPRPRSMPGLLLAAFALVALPLMLAVAVGVVYVDRLSTQSERLVQRGVQVTRLGNELTDIVLAMERNVRQYAVLGETELSNALADRHDNFQATVDALAALNLETVSDWNLDEVRARGRTIAEAVADSPAAAQSLLDQRPQLFTRLRERTEAITDQANRFIDNEVSRLQETAGDARTFLVLCVFAVLPGAALVVALLTVVISRPIRQIRQAMQQLGEGDFSQRVKLSAPAGELDALGSQLDWLRRRLETLESEKNQFLRHMSHELKTPLASIREGTELLRDQSLGTLSTEQSEVADILYRSGLELQSLIENLLNFAAWRQHRGRIVRSRFDLGRVIDEVLARHRLSIRNKNLTIERPDGEFPIDADRDQTRLALDNLVANAVKFSPPDGGIYIDVAVQRRTWSLEIADDGPGILREDWDHVFNPFYQSKQTEKARVKGTGIGLSVVREAVRAHGGAIKIRHGRGKGACFHLSIPRQGPQ